MLPPVLEIYVVWHPGDMRGLHICNEFVEHFHGTVFSGLIGGAIEVYARSSGWQLADDAPRPIPLQTTGTQSSSRPAQFIAIVPILGNEMANAVQQKSQPWWQYIQNVVDSHDANPHRIGLFPYLLDDNAIKQTILGNALSRYQRIAANPVRDGDTEKSVRCRDLTQGIAQLLSQPANKRLTVFISHTKRNSSGETENVETLIAAVREVIGTTRLQDFFDANDLQPGQDWDQELRNMAAESALLALRTDLYPSREWCQREVLISKREGMPVIIMDALGNAEERGSFLMDHVPRVPARMENGCWRKADIIRGLNLLVDECLKRELWRHQAQLARDELSFEIAWWAPHAPEPITLTKWLENQRQVGTLSLSGDDLVILHPDPPLGADEKSVLQEILLLAGIHRRLDVMTPRLLAARGG
ncbi:MAG: toll/interleukin-1 receptor domain-containing protein [Nitrospira sp.]|nr:toll/interleukin-1 receptor domain-containing protein [Nitrospira sp.]